MSVELPRYTHCKVFADNKLIMFTDAIPTFDLEKNKVSFPRMAVIGCFQGSYLGTDFTIELYRDGLDKKPAVLLIDAGIMAFGKLNLTTSEAGQFVIFENMEFQYDRIKDKKKYLGKGGSKLLPMVVT